MASRTSPQTRAPQSRSRAASKSTPAPGLGYKILRAFGRAITALWLAIAHAVGAVVRSIGRPERELAPEDRRDGIALGVIAGSVVLGVSVWGSGAGVLSQVLQFLIGSATGRIAWLIPIIVFSLGVRLMRHPDESSETGRMAIGIAAISVALLGLTHMISGSPQPVEGADAVRQGAGYLGFFISSPAVAAVGTWISSFLFILVFIFGLLVFTATPVHEVTEHGRTLVGLILARFGSQEEDVIDLRDRDDDEEEDDEEYEEYETFGQKAWRMTGLASLFARDEEVEPEFEIDPDRDRPFDSPIIAGTDEAEEEIDEPIEDFVVSPDHPTIEVSLTDIAAAQASATAAQSATASTPATSTTISLIPASTSS